MISANRTRFLGFPVVGWMLLSCVPAYAQLETPSPARQTLDQQIPVVDVPDGAASPMSSIGPGVSGDELGISVGAFTLFPSMELDAGYDTNVFAQATSTVASPFALARPSLELRSEWLNHSLRLVASGAWGFYSAAPTQNFENYLVQADGRLDIRTDMYLTGMVAIRRSTEALGTPNVAFAQAPTVVDSVPVQVAFYQKFNRLYYQLSASATRFWYHDFSTITSLGLPATSRDRTDYEESLRIGYEILDGVSVWVSPSLNQSNYVDTINAAGQQRDSRGFGAVVGGTLSLGPKSNLDGFIGLTSLTYLVGGATTSAMTFGLTGTWNPYEPLVLRPAISRTINASALSNYANYVSTVIGIDFSYDIHGPWKAVGGIGYNIADFTPAAGVPNVPPRTDTFVKASIGLLYQLRPQFSIGPLYEYSQGVSTDTTGGGPEYSRSMFSIRLVAKR
ncbi:hypothetical protein BH11PSE3_BH11PSE3_18490 [soil metagenome]